MEKKITNAIFNKNVTHYYNVLKKSYLKEIEQAADREYAEKHYQKVFFTENEYVPLASILFDELIVVYNHFNRLYGKDNTYEKVFELITEVRLIAKKALSNAEKYLKGDTTVKIADWYAEQIENDFQTLEDLVLLEQKMLAMTDENISAGLGVYVAGQELNAEFQEDNTEQSNVKENQKGRFTQNERLLALSILTESLGFRQGLYEDRTTLSALYLLIMDKNFGDDTKIKNTNVYKSLGNMPFVVSDPLKLSKYLRNIRPFFEKTNMVEAVKLIDEKIKSCK